MDAKLVKTDISFTVFHDTLSHFKYYFTPSLFANFTGYNYAVEY